MKESRHDYFRGNRLLEGGSEWAEQWESRVRKKLIGIIQRDEKSV